MAQGGGHPVLASPGVRGGAGAGGECSALRSTQAPAAAQALQAASSEEAWARLGFTLPSPLVVGQAK